MNKKKVILIAAALVLVAAVVVAAVALGRSELGTGRQAFEILRQCIDAPSLSMELRVTARLESADLSFTALVERSQWEGHSITTVTRDSNTLCYTGGVILPENGRAYRLSDRYPDYSRLLEQVLPLYENIQLEAQEGVYSITAQDADAEMIISTLLPGLDLQSDSLTVELETEEDQLTQLRFKGDLEQEGKKCRITATVSILGEQTTVAIPKAVQETIRAGQLEAAEDLSDDILRLIGAWSRLSSGKAIGAKMTLSADCGSLKLQDDMQLYRKGSISAIEKFGRMLYFTDSAICDTHGNRVSTADADAVQSGKLLDLAWKFCMESHLACKQAGRIYTYTLTLDQDGMEQLAQIIAPDSATLGIRFQSGGILLELNGDRLETVEISISGYIGALLVQIPASLSASFAIDEDVNFQIPPAVRNALQ